MNTNTPIETLTAEAFLEKLNNDGLTKPPFLLGMVKKSDTADHINFAPGNNCNAWTLIPVSMIDKVDVIGQTPCKDHSHPIVRLYIKSPTSEESKVLHQLVLNTLGNAQSHGGENYQAMPMSMPPSPSMQSFSPIASPYPPDGCYVSNQCPRGSKLCCRGGRCHCVRGLATQNEPFSISSFEDDMIQPLSSCVNYPGCPSGCAQYDAASGRWRCSYCCIG